MNKYLTFKSDNLHPFSLEKTLGLVLRNQLVGYFGQNMGGIVFQSSLTECQY